MMSKTHFAMGLATSLAVVQPKTYDECLVAVIGGAMGGVLADCDILDNDYKSDALIGQLLAAGTTIISLLIDYFFRLGIVQSILDNKILSIIGFIIFCILYIVGVCSNHRTFTHSLMALVLFGIAVALINVPIAIGFIVSYVSHLILDVLNKKKVPVLYPLKWGVCLKLFYANKTANKVFMYIGFFMSALLLSVFIVRCSM